MSLLEKIKVSWAHDPKKLIVDLFGALIILGAILMGSSMLFPPQPKVILAGDKQVASQPIIVKFSSPPSRHSINLEISPNIPVLVSWTGGFFGQLSKTMIITPETNWDIDTLYNLSFSNVGGVVGIGKKTAVVIQLPIQGLPEVKGTSLSGVKEVIPDAPINIELTEPTENVADFFFELEPKAEFSVAVSGNQYAINFTEPLEQGEEYALTISRQLLVYNVETGEVEKRLKKAVVAKESFTTRAPALVKSSSPKGSSVLPDQEKFSLTFNEPMDKQSVLSRIAFMPTVPGNWTWRNSQTLDFNFANKLSVDKKYEVIIAAGARAISGSFIDEKETLSFKTVGGLKVARSSPYQGQMAVGLNDNIVLNFDQPVEKNQLLNNLSINPELSYTSSWSGNAVSINPSKALSYSQAYTLKIKSGVETTYGKPLANDYLLAFTTELRRFVLSIPIDYQDRALSCEAAALKMALNYRGKSVSESDIMSIIGYDSTIKQGNVWGDPDIAFVGNIDGSQNSTGYGVHWAPIAKAAKNWRNAKAFSGWTVSQLAKELAAGNPVVIWGVLGNTYYDPWKTPDGRTIKAWKGEHARTAIGFVGSTSNPTSFIINDPIVGRIAWSTATLKSNWGVFSNSGVVVY